MVATVAVLVDDLFFLAKIQETAKAVGAKVLTLNAQSGSAAVAEAQPRAVIIDLNLRSASPLDSIRALKGNPATSPIPVVAFVSHVQEQLIADARAAGCDSVLARSAFTRQLPELLRSLVSQTETAS